MKRTSSIQRNGIVFLSLAVGALLAWPGNVRAAPAALSSAANQTFTINDSTTTISTVTVTDANPQTIATSTDIRIKIGSAFPMEWDTTDLTATISGSASSKIAASSTKEWGKVAGDGVNSSWDSASADHERVLTLHVLNNTLYAGLGYSAGDAEVWEWPGSGDWTQKGGDGLNASWASSTYEGVFELSTFNNKLYAGLGFSLGEAEVWEWPGSGDWTQKGGDGLNASWASSTYEAVGELATFNGRLYAGLGVTGAAGDAEVWEWPGSGNWTKVAGDGVNSSWSGTYDTMRSLSSFNNKLYAGLGDNAGEAEVWEWSGSGNWTQVGGDGLNASWASSTYEVAFSSAEFNGKFYVGLGSSAGDAEVWEWPGSGNWTLVGGDGTNGSWSGTAYETIRSLESFNNKLYAGLGDSAGDGEMWEWAGSGNWTQVGGDGLNASWASSTYETVFAIQGLNGVLFAGLGVSAGDPEIWGMRTGPISYENVKSAVINVTTNFSGADTLTLADLGFTNFTAAAAPSTTLQLFVGGSSDTIADATDDKTKTVKGTLNLAEHTSGQIGDQWATSTPVTAVHHRFRLAPSGENMTIAQATTTLSAITGVAQSDITLSKLWQDTGSTAGSVDGSDTLIDDAGVVAIASGTGTLTWTTSTAWTVTTSTNYLVELTVTNLASGDTMTLAQEANKIVATGVTSTASISVGGLAATATSTHTADTGGSIPTQPGTPTYTDVGTSTLTIQWTAATSSDYYKIERATSSEQYVQFATTTATSTPDTGRTPNTTYFYRVRGTNTNGDGPYSATSSVRMLPEAPTTPTYTSVATSTLTVNWTSTNGADYYKIERATSSESYIQIATTTATNYGDQGRTPHTTYFYRIRGTNTNGDGPYSATSSKLMLPGAPTAPTYSNVATSTLTVNWTSTNGADYYKIERATSSESYIQIATTTPTSYNDSGLATSTTYWYRVRGNNATGDGPYSATSSVTTSGGGFTPSGSLTSLIIDTQVTGGIAPNSFFWEGDYPANTVVKFQLASATSTSGPWTYVGWNTTTNACDSSSYYTPSAQNVAVEIKAVCHQNHRYLRYKVFLETSNSSVTPRVDRIILNYAR